MRFAKQAPIDVAPGQYWLLFRAAFLLRCAA